MCKSRATTYFLKKNRALKLFSDESWQHKMFGTPAPGGEDTGAKVMTFLQEIYTDEDSIMCDNDHPVIYLQMGKEEDYVVVLTLYRGSLPHEGCPKEITKMLSENRGYKRTCCQKEVEDWMKENMDEDEEEDL